MSETAWSPPRGKKAGQFEELVSRLRDLIRGYPFGTGLVKELLQNADDAGATTVRFVLDTRTVDARPEVANSPWGRLLGPALRVESDQTFSDADLAAIQKLSARSKLDQVSKTGRFGLGFNTVYNITDYPGFATGTHIQVFDPHRDLDEDLEGQQWSIETLTKDFPELGTAFGIPHGASDMQGRTVFRLPLRRPEQVGPDRIEPHEVWTIEKVEEVLSKAAAEAPELLIFLKHVFHLEFEVIDSAGQTRVIASVRTRDVEQVAGARVRVIQALSTTQALFWGRYAGSEGTLGNASYLHEFVISRDGAIQDETWMLAQQMCLETSNVNPAALKLLERGEKAVPLVGAAIRVERTESGIRPVPVGGKFYCGLPLENSAGTSFHVNAYFDIDSSRRGLTHTSSKGDEHRVAWNRALMDVAIPQVAGTLLERLAAELAPDAIDIFYELFPTSERVEDYGLGFCESFYDWLGSYEIFRAQASGRFRWLRYEDLPQPWSTCTPELAAALRYDGLEMADPPVPEHIADALMAQGWTSVQVSPEQISNWLRELPGEPEELQRTIQCLASADFVLELVKYCVAAKPPNLDGVPLALMDDGSLATFGGGEKRFHAGASVRRIFADRTGDFLEPNVGDVVAKFGASLGVIVPAPVGVLRLIRHFYLKRSSDPVRWRPGAKSPPNTQWLGSVYGWLLEVDEHSWPKAEAQLTPLVPGNDGHLYPFGTATTPMIVDDATAPPSAVAVALRAFKAVTVNAEPALKRQLINIAAQAAASVRMLTRNEVVVALGARQKATGSAGGPAKKHRHALIAWLAAGTRTDAFGELDAHAIATLRGLPIWDVHEPTPVALSSGRFFLPTGFEAPSGLATVRFVDPPDKGNAVRNLLHSLGVKQLTAAVFVKDFIVARDSTLTDEQRGTLIGWLQQGVWAQLSELNDENSREAREGLCGMKIVPSTSGGFARAGDLFFRDATGVELLGEDAETASVASTSEADHEARIRLFRGLGVQTAVSPQHLVNRIVRLSERSRDDDGAANLQIVACFDRLVQLANGEKEREVESAVAVLVGRAWMPCALPQDMSEHSVLPARWPKRRHRPEDVQPWNVARFVASSAPVSASRLSVSNRLSSALKLPTGPTATLVLGHLRKLAEAWGDGRIHDSRQRDLGSEIEKLYGWLSSIGRANVDAATIATLRDAAIIWSSSAARFVSPSMAFKSVPPAFADYWTRVDFSLSAWDFLSRVGVRDRPEVENYIAFVRNAGSSESAVQLGADTLNRVLAALREVASVLSDLQPDAAENLPLPTESGLLMPARVTVVERRPRIRDRVASDLVHLVSSQVDGRLAQMAGGRLGSDCYDEVLAVDPIASSDSDVSWWAADAAAFLQQSSFRKALTRLLVAEHPDAGLEDIRKCVADIAALKLIAVDGLETELVFRGRQGTKFGRKDVRSFFDGDGAATLYFSSAGHEREELARALASAIRSVLADKDRALRDGSPLEALLRTLNPELCDSTLDSYDVPRGVVYREADSEPYDALLPIDSDLGTEADAETEAIDAPCEAEEAAAADAPEDDITDSKLDSTLDSVAVDAGQGEDDAATCDVSEPVQCAAADIAPGRSDQSPTSATTVAGSSGSTGSAGTLGQSSNRAKAAGDASPGVQRDSSVPIPPPIEPGRATTAEPSTPGTRGGRGAGRSAQSRNSAAGTLDPDSGLDALGGGANDASEASDSSDTSSGSKPPSSKAPGAAQPRDRLVSYVAQQPDSDDEDDESNDADGEPAAERKRTDEAAIECVLDHARAMGAEVEKMPHHNKGFDLRLHYPGEAHPRIVEVKGRASAWDKQGVGLSKAQFARATAEGDSYWLYVVEHAVDPQLRRLLRIQNPAGRIGAYYFDVGWASAAESEDAPTAPVVGRELWARGGSFIGTIVGVKQYGELLHLHVRQDDGSLTKVVFRRETHEVRLSGEGE